MQQFLEENYLRRDSLGGFLALATSLEHLVEHYSNKRAAALAKMRDQANGQILDHDKFPARNVGELDNRGSHYHLALYWAQALTAQDGDAELKAKFAPLAKALTENEATIVDELVRVQGKPVDIGGYYKADAAKTQAVMRPSPTFNAALKAASLG